MRNKTIPDPAPMSNATIRGWLASLTHLLAANAVRTVNITEPSALSNLVEGTKVSFSNAIKDRDQHAEGSPEWEVHNGAVLGHQQFLKSLIFVHEGVMESYSVANAELMTARKKHEDLKATDQ